MNLVKIECLDSYLPMIDRWIEHNDTTEDSSLDGRKMDTRSILLDKANGIEFFYIDPEDRTTKTAGIVAHSSKGEFLEGAIFWIEPEYRGEISIQELFDRLIELARISGKSGIRFESKIWGNSPILLGFDLIGKKQDGADTVCVWQRTVAEV